MSFLGSLFGGGNDKKQYDASNAQVSQLLQQNADTSSFLKGQGAPLISQGAATLQGPLDYYNKLFSGDRATASAALGPALDTLKMNQQQSLQNVDKFAPRGGGRTATTASSDTARDAQLSKLLMSTKPAAGDALASAGLNLANLGSGLVGGSSNINATGLSTLLNQANLASNRQMSQQQMAMQLVNSYLSAAGAAAGGA